MPQPHRPTSPPPQPLVRAPVCKTCNTPMKLVLIEPHDRYTNLDEWTYNCECGAQASQFVTRSAL
jgi:hypothetical protein